jgi:glutamine amidotransferase-like uncharacterized protein
MLINIYNDKGLNKTTPKIWKDFFSVTDIYDIQFVKADDILSGNPTAILFPGGSASIFATKLGKKRRKKIVKWVEDGGIYIGVCAGAYLASSTYEWSLGISPIIVSRNWCKGKYDVKIKINDNEHLVNYFNGPTCESWENVEVIGTYTEGIPHYQSTINSPAITFNQYETGKVFLISPHLEKKESTLDVLHDLLRKVIMDI